VDLGGSEEVPEIMLRRNTFQSGTFHAEKTQQAKKNEKGDQSERDGSPLSGHKIGKPSFS